MLSAFALPCAAAPHDASPPAPSALGLPSPFSLAGTGAHDDWRLTADMSAQPWSPDSRLLAAAPRFSARDALAGESSHASLRFDWRRRGPGSRLHGSVHAQGSSLETRAEADALAARLPGGTFGQSDRRSAFGGELGWQGHGDAAFSQAARISFAGDSLDAAAHFGARGAGTLETVRHDAMRASAVGLAWTGEWAIAPRLTAIAGLAAERYRFDVASDLAGLSGHGEGSLAAPRLSLVFAPHHRMQLYLSASRGEPAADGRLARLAFDPRSLAPLGRLDPASKGERLEAGARAALPGRVDLRLSAWRLDTDPEWRLAGTQGVVDIGRPLRRDGVTLALTHSPTAAIDLELQATALGARFRDGAGESAAGIATRYATAGATVRAAGGWTAKLFVSYFGARPAMEEDGVMLRSSSTVSGQLSRRLSKHARLSVDVFNVFDQRVGDIDYFSASRQASALAAPADGFFFHPAESRGLRVQLRTTF